MLKFQFLIGFKGFSDQMSCNCAYCIRFLSQSSLKPGLIPFMEMALNVPFSCRSISFTCSALKYVFSASLLGSIFRYFNLASYVDFPIRAYLVDLRLSPQGGKSCFHWNSSGIFKSGLHNMYHTPHKILINRNIRPESTGIPVLSFHCQ